MDRCSVTKLILSATILKGSFGMLSVLSFPLIYNVHTHTAEQKRLSSLLPLYQPEPRQRPDGAFALGHALMIHSWIAMALHITPSLLAGASSCECALRLTGSAGKQLTSFTFRAHPFTSSRKLIRGLP